MRCAEVRGFNYDGSWGTSGLDLWLHHDNGTMAVEIDRGKQYFPGWNVARWWLSDEAFQRDPRRFLANFEAGLAIFARQGIQVMPLLFNRWRDPVCDFGGVCLEHIVPGLSNLSGGLDLFGDPDDPARVPPLIERLHRTYLETLVGPYAVDERIFAWDLCNEPLMAPYVEDPQSPIRAAELRWLAWCYKTVKRIGARQPLTISSYPHPSRRSWSNRSAISSRSTHTTSGTARVRRSTRWRATRVTWTSAWPWPGAAARRWSPRRRSGVQWTTRSARRSCATHLVSSAGARSALSCMPCSTAWWPTCTTRPMARSAGRG